MSFTNTIDAAFFGSFQLCCEPWISSPYIVTQLTAYSPKNVKITVENTSNQTQENKSACHRQALHKDCLSWIAI